MAEPDPGDRLVAAALGAAFGALVGLIVALLLLRWLLPEDGALEPPLTRH